MPRDGLVAPARLFSGKVSRPALAERWRLDAPTTSSEATEPATFVELSTHFFDHHPPMNEPLDVRPHARIAAIVCVAAVVVLSVVPGSDRPHVFHSGNLEHFVAYGGTAVLLVFGSSRGFARVWPVVLSVASAIFEVLQIWIPGRSAGFENWLASTAGACTGTVFALLLARSIARRFV